MTPEQTLRQIQRLTEVLLETGVCDLFVTPGIYERDGGWRSVGIGRRETYSMVLKDESYADAYSLLSDDRAYIMKLHDGTMIQMNYEYQNGELMRHRLACLPRPYAFESIELADLEHASDIYSEVRKRRFLPIPIRFDLDKTVPETIRAMHPHSHLTIGGFDECRVPVSAPLSPVGFVRFVLKNFLARVYQRISTLLNGINGEFAECISAEEAQQLHVRLGT